MRINGTADNGVAGRHNPYQSGSLFLTGILPYRIRPLADEWKQFRRWMHVSSDTSHLGAVEFVDKL